MLAEDLWISGQLELDLGDGNDQVEIHSGSLGALSVDAGAGMDMVTVELATILGKTDIKLGKGGDILTVIDSIFGDDTLIDGGLDDDLLTLLGTNIFSGNQKLKRFEYVR